MPDIFKRWCECNPDRAQQLGRAVRLWLAYLGLVTFGALITGPLIYAWFDGQMIQMRADQTAELQRMQDINRQLVLIIEKRLPAIAETAGAAAETASGAAVTARAAADAAKQAAGAAGTAGRAATTAATTAKAAASTAGQVARKVDQAVTPRPLPPMQDPDEWLK